MKNFDPTVSVGTIIYLIFAIAGLVYIVRGNQSKLGKTTNQKFWDWASIMTPIGGGVALILPLIQRNPFMTGSSLCAGTVTLLIPFAYTALFPSSSRIIYFLLGSTLMVLSVLFQLAIAANLSDDLVVTDIPKGFLYCFRALMAACGIVLLLYARRSLIDIIKESK